MRIARLLLALVTLLLTPAAFAEPQRLALVIGNQDYPAGVGKLSYPKADAKRVSDALTAVGFTTTVLEDLDHAEFAAALAAFTEKLELAGAETIAFVYYSGHGAAVSDARGDNYLVPVGTSLKTMDDLRVSGVRLSGILDSLRATNIMASYVVIDACRDSFLEATTKNTTKGLVPTGQAVNQLVAFATREKRTAVDSPIFSTALADEIVKPGRDTTAMFKAVQRRVAQETGNAQQPYIEDGVLDVICFAGCEGGDPTPRSGLASAAPAPAAADPSVIVERAKFLLVPPQEPAAPGADIPDADVAAIDGGLLAAGYEDGKVRIWRLADRALIADIKAHAKEVTAIALDAKAGVLATAGEGEPLRLWNIATAKKTAEGGPNTQGAELIGLDVTAGQVVTLDSRRDFLETLRLRDLATTGTLDLNDALSGSASTVAWDWASRQAVVAGFGTVAMVDLRAQSVSMTRRRLPCADQPDCRIAHAAIAPGGGMFAVGTDGGALMVYNRSGSLVTSDPKAICIDGAGALECDLRGLGFLGRQLLTVVRLDGKVNLFDPASLRRVRIVRPPTSSAYAGGIAGGDTLWLASSNGSVGVVQFDLGAPQ